jgi:methionyl-tRNA synthetase
MKKFYVTTSIYYVNAKPHIGHCYESTVADALARYHRLKGEDVYFLTGTDEHGQKVAKAAAEAGITTQAFVDSVVKPSLELWKVLSISYDDFIRTTQERHIKVVQLFFSRLHEKGELYESEYKGWYCASCEAFWPEGQLEEGSCPECKRQVEQITEKNWFFRMSKYQEWLIGYIKGHPDFIKPESRKNEILSFLEQPLQDLCVTRPKSRLEWGIEIPFSRDHVSYVWFDALINYISALGYAGDEAKFKRYWPADIHILGKDIIRFHTVFWPIMLHALGIEPPVTVFAHGHWLDGKGRKMSKSLGNIVDPVEMIKKYGPDPLRYFLLSEIPYGHDGLFSEEALVSRLNTDLANDMGNLLNRTLTMIEKYFGSMIPAAAGTKGAVDDELKALAAALPDKMDAAMSELDFPAALASVWELINRANKYIEIQAPWKLDKEGKVDRLSDIIYNLTEVLRIVTIAVSSYIPASAEKMWSQLGITEPLSKARFSDIGKWGLIRAGTKTNKGQPLFPRIEQK